MTTVFMTIPVRYDGRPGSEPHPLGEDITDRDYLAAEIDLDGLPADDPARSVPFDLDTAVRIYANDRFPRGWYTTYLPGPEWDKVRGRFALGRRVEIPLAATRTPDGELLVVEPGTVAP